MKIPKRLMLLAGCFIVVLFTVPLAVGYLFTSGTSTDVSSISNIEMNQRLRPIVSEFTSIPDAAGDDILSLSNSNGVKNLLSSGDVSTVADITTFLQYHSSYYQIKYLDLAGMELFSATSANQVVSVKAKSELNSQATSDYFQESVKLDQGEVYLSNIMAANDVARPLIYFGTPVFSGNHKVGILVLAVNIDQLLNGQPPIHIAHLYQL